MAWDTKDDEALDQLIRTKGMSQILAGLVAWLGRSAERGAHRGWELHGLLAEASHRFDELSNRAWDELLNAKITDD